MKRVGEVVRIAQELAVMRSPDDDHPDIGTPLVNQDLEEVGRVVDVFGPVDRPFVAVSTTDDVTLPTLLGEKLYTR